MQIFYSPDIESSYMLPEQEAIHALKVLRLGKNALVHVIDGKGNLFEVKILTNNVKHCEVEVLSKTYTPKKRTFGVHVALAPTKNIDRTTWFIEKATEIGIDTISFLLCEHSERKQINLPRVSKICVSACKQSLKTHVPQINPLEKFEDFIKKDWGSSSKYMAYIDKSEESPVLFKVIKSNQNYLILIGPEGGFSLKEVNIAKLNGFETISLGQERLRTETAAFCACHTLHLLNEINFS